MKILDTRGYLTIWHCLAYAIKNNTFASLTSGSEHSFKYVTYVTWHKIVLEVRDDISEKY